MPKKGSFIKIWEFDNKVWADSFHWINCRLHVYDAECDEFTLIDERIVGEDVPEQENPRYLIVGED